MTLSQSAPDRSPDADAPPAPSRAQRDAVLSAVVRDSLRPIALGLSLIYVISAVHDWFLNHTSARHGLTLSGAVTAGVLALLALALSRDRVQPRAAHRLGLLLMAVVVASQSVSAALTGDPGESVYLMGYMAALGAFAMLGRYMVMGFALGWLAWTAAAWRGGFSEEWLRWLLPMAIGMALGVLLHVHRRRAVLGVEALRLKESHRAALLQETLDRLARSEALFREFADHSGLVFWINDRQPHHATYVNRVYETLFGRSIESLRNDPMDWISAVFPQDRQRVRDAYLTCLEKGEFQEIYRIVRPDGQVRWVQDHGFLIRSDDGGPARVGGIVADITEQVTAARELETSQKANQAILRSLPDLIIRYRRDGTCLSMQHARDFPTLWPHASPVGRNLREWLPPDLAQRSLAAFAAALDTGQLQTMEYSGAADSLGGALYWREARFCPIGNDEVLVIVRDFTARRLAEQALAASRQKLSDLVNDIAGVVWEAEVGKFNFTFVSPQAQVMFRYPLQQWIDDPQFFRKLIHPDDFDRTINTCARKTALGLDHELEYRVITADGRVLWVNDRVRVITDEAGKPVRLRGIIVDTTDAMRAAQALRDSQTLLARSQEIAHVGSWTWDTASHRVVWSSQMYLITGITPEQFDGSWTTALSLVHPEDQEKVWEVYQRAIETRTVEPIEYRIVRPDGQERMVRADAELEYLEDGSFSRVVGTVQDVTEIRRAEADRARLEEELRQVQKLEAIGTLASGVAHDFNNLLTAINGYTDLAVRLLDEQHPAREPLNMVHLAARHAGGVTRSLLTFAQRTPTHKTPLPLGPNIRETTQLLRRLLPAAITIAEDIPDDLNVWVNAEGHQLQQVWMNLAINARDAMPRGGTLTVRLRRLSDAPVSPLDSWIGSLEDTAVVTVADTGLGMAEETVRRIFEPYFTTKPRGQGTGLGLSILHGILSDHAGRVRVHSKPGKGTIFTIYLPCCAPPVPDAPRALIDDNHAPGRGETVLLAEDSDYVRAIIHSALSAAGYQVLAARDGRQTLQLFEENRDAVGLLVLDLDLPIQSGAACLDKVREARPDLPVLIVTANACEMLDRGLRPQEAILPKPFQVGNLVEMVDGMMNKVSAKQ